LAFTTNHVYAVEMFVDVEARAYLNQGRSAFWA
jgi:hypothetical protein